MDAISTASLYQSALLNITNAEQAEALATAQAGSEKVSNDLQGYGSSAATLTASNTLQSRITSHISNSQAVAAKLDVQDSALTSFANAAQGAATAISDAIATNDATSLTSALQAQLGQAATALNTQYNGQYLFAGGQVNTQPFTGTDLASLPSQSTASLFQNDQHVAANRLDDNTVVQTGLLASTIGTPLTQAFSDLQAYASSNGPLTGTLTSAQSAGLQTILKEFSSAVTAANAVVGQNGVIQNQVADAQTSLTDQQSALTNVIGGITDVDEGQVATNLNLAQTALQASAKVFTSLQSDSLLNILAPTG